MGDEELVAVLARAARDDSHALGQPAVQLLEQAAWREQRLELAETRRAGHALVDLLKHARHLFQRRQMAGRVAALTLDEPPRELPVVVGVARELALLNVLKGNGGAKAHGSGHDRVAVRERHLGHHAVHVQQQRLQRRLSRHPVRVACSGGELLLSV